MHYWCRKRERATHKMRHIYHDPNQLPPLCAPLLSFQSLLSFLRCCLPRPPALDVTPKKKHDLIILVAPPHWVFSNPPRKSHSQSDAGRNPSPAIASSAKSEHKPSQCRAQPPLSAIPALKNNNIREKLVCAFLCGGKNTVVGWVEF